MQSDDIAQLNAIRTKLVANLKFFEELMEKLNENKAVSEDEKEAITGELESGTNLIMDGKEILGEVNEKILNYDGVEDKSDVEVKILEKEKMQLEIQKLNMEIEYKRSQAEKMMSVITGTKQQVKLPRMELPKFSGKLTE